MATMFLYMVAELSALQQIMTALTGMDGLPMVIVQCVVATIYTSLGGFKISFITDNIQGAMVVCLIIIATITIGVKTDIDTSLIDSSGLTQASLLGWQLLYILPVAVLTNDFFLSNFWIRAFASKTDKDLWIGISIAAVVVLIILTLIGCTGLIAVWSGALGPDDIESSGSIAFFLLLERLPAWVVGIVLVMVVSLSTAAFDSFQSAMVSMGSNDLFRNKLNIWFIRAAVVLLIVPVIILALKAPSILQIYLISDLFSASSIPVLILGLSDRFYWWRGFEVVVGGLGGIITVFIFGTIYYGNAQAGADLILLEGGLYANDWSVFGAFVAAPVGGLLWGFGAFVPSTHTFSYFSPSTISTPSKPETVYHNLTNLHHSRDTVFAHLLDPTNTTQPPRDPGTLEFMSIENLKTFVTDPFAEADEDTGETKQSQNYIHIRIQQRNGRKTLTTVQGLPKKFDQKKILKVIKKKFACNGTIVVDSEMGEVIQLQGDQRKDVQEFLTDKKEGLELDAKTIKVHGF
ncbi:putative Eukaryotic translation initiation factor eIF-1 [Glarea lozoyensis 74030]|uniref:Putative Eukaryotic translation initiation factor eIF-1 n=1 Tax=Glarea lozoyensis (strain ATCC 74030 / MF5533) TaxID=1104152 RepID=H0EVD7_GLAL7|nr:putative Eukaryotic translation initiation factor eIF-1 [Glarea lozoyensis 74030]